MASETVLFQLSRELIKELKSQGADAVGRMVRGHAKCLRPDRSMRNQALGISIWRADYRPFGSIVKIFVLVLSSSFSWCIARQPEG
jgi:hypothetical protein